MRYPAIIFCSRSRSRISLLFIYLITLLLLVLTNKKSNCQAMSTPSTASGRRPTLRKISSTVSSISNDDSSDDHDATAKKRVQKMVQHSKEGTPLTDEEVQDICNSIQNLVPTDAPIDFGELKELLKSVAHLSHKDWGVTSDNSEKLSSLLSVGSKDDNDGESLSPHARQLLERILTEGNWFGAVKSAPPMNSPKRKPWAVLVTGVNGIRKTTSMYQPWFDSLLSEALCSPPDVVVANKPKNLPTGSNSFFRQLDHMICTLTNEEFAKLYHWAASQLPSDGSPSEQLVKDYSDYKAALFTRYRTLSELLGGLLLREAQKVNMNCLMETSGRDVAMFHYVDHFFDSTKYNKLALHFTINDLECAKLSVDRRMIQEIQEGVKAVKSEDVFDIIYANAGGPYGSQVLEGVQKDSDKVWETEVLSGNVGRDWYKASIIINAHATEPWTAQAVKPDGSLGTEFTFERR